MRVGVVISGGFDSAVLWHMINKLYANTGAVVTPYTVPKVDGSIRHANMMLESYSKKNNVKRIHTRRVGIVDQTNRYPDGATLLEQLVSGLREILYADIPLADVVYTGASPFPKHLVDNFPFVPRDRNFTRGTEWEDVCKQPFDTYTKDMLVAIAMDENILDNIKDVTHSCVTQDRGRCNECFWCQEREWAFTTNGRLDGTN
jgi:7-cyano-7-deazaguanine synthase in queuosine biosynthesis